MQKEKKKILAHRLIWFVLLLSGVICTIKLLTTSNVYNFDIYDALMILFFYDLISVTLFIASFLLSCKNYEYDGNKIVVYSGWYHHYISVNGVIVDEYNTFTSLTPIWLSCTLSDDIYLQATISAFFNRIALKINDKLYQEIR